MSDHTKTNQLYAVLLIAMPTIYKKVSKAQKKEMTLIDLVLPLLSVIPTKNR
jgi:hypothetical protein